MDGEDLIAPYMRTRWQPQQNTAACVEYPDEAAGDLGEPEWLIRNSGARCACGAIHRYHTRDCVPLGYPKNRARELSLMPAEPPPAGVAVIAYAEHHHAPAHDCRCGLYAYHRPLSVGTCPCRVCGKRHDPWQLTSEYPLVQQVPLLGALHAWGTIETATAGFRAEYAAPVVLAPYTEHAYTGKEMDGIRTLADAYGCLLVTQDKLVPAAQAYGSSLAGYRDEEIYAQRAPEISSSQLHLRMGGA